MHLGAVKALEFDRMVEALCSLALTPLGAARLAKLRPEVDVRRFEPQLALTTEGVEYLRDDPAFPLHAPADLERTLVALAVDGRALEPQQLLDLADHLVSIEATCAGIHQTDPGRFPMLRGIVDACSSFAVEAADVRGKIAASGDVLDEASPKLRAMRERHRRQRNRLRTTLESYLRGRETARYLQEQIVTDRDGRYVLVVKAEHRTAIPGIVHGASASGASLFLEPLSTVEVNNEIVALEEQIAEEIRRILLALSDAFRKRALDLQRTIEIATKLDVVQAKARLSELMDGAQPEISTDGRLELRGARHPLLIPAVTRRLSPDAGRPVSDREHGSVVPVDISIPPPATALVITGPNTGGKTVALKTAGLLALMAQAGLRIPAAPGSCLPLFGSVFADIGDEQSIAASLSTFSGHVTNIASMDRALVLPSLVLLDEVGAGTDPSEGAALGMAIIEHFRRRGALVIATTHYDVLKSYAATTPGVAVAAFGFDEQTFEPSYRLVYGSPGRSLAIEIALRLGLPPAIIEAARGARGTREAQLEAHLARVEEDVAALEARRTGIAREEARLATVESALSAREETVRDGERALGRKYESQLASRLREARQEIDRLVEEVKRRGETLASEAAHRAARGESVLSTGDTGELRAAAHRQLSSIAEPLEAAPGASELLAELDSGSASPTPTVGQHVSVKNLGLNGVVRLVSGPDAEVEVRGKRLRVAVSELQGLAQPTVAAPISVEVQLQPRTVQLDLNLIGCTVDEALARAEKFLDDAVLAEQTTVRVIHGYGTGQLRRAIAGLLHDHPLVARFEAAPPHEGGGGVTVVELRE